MNDKLQKLAKKRSSEDILITSERSLILNNIKGLKDLLTGLTHDELCFLRIYVKGHNDSLKNFAPVAALVATIGISGVSATVAGNILTITVTKYGPLTGVVWFTTSSTSANGVSAQVTVPGAQNWLVKSFSLTSLGNLALGCEVDLNGVSLYSMINLSGYSINPLIWSAYPGGFRLLNHATSSDEG